MDTEKTGRQSEETTEAQVRRLASLGILLAEVSHEINNLMMGVLGYAELEKHRQEGPASENLARIVQCAKTAGGLTRTVLNLARPPGAHSPGNLADALAAVLDMFRHRTHEIPILVEVPATLPPVALHGGDLQLVLANLIKNAFDATSDAERPSIRISARVREDRVRLRIWNASAPIPEEVLSRALTRFATTKDPDQGTGLGLSISARLVTQAGGGLTIENARGGGVVVTVELPAAPRQAAPEKPPAPVTVPRLEPGRRVLVVDDDPTAREVLSVMVEEMGAARVRACASGEEALEILRREPFDAVVLDLRMTGISGQAVYRALPDALKRRVVFVTGDTVEPSTRRFLEATPQPALYKPVDWKELARAVGRVLAA